MLKANGKTVNAIAEKVGVSCTISVDELTGIVALGLPSPDLMPTGAWSIKRDYEYGRFGMVTLIAGKARRRALVSDTHKAQAFHRILEEARRAVS